MQTRRALAILLALELGGILAGQAVAAPRRESHGRWAPLVQCSLLTPQRFEACGERQPAPDFATGSVRPAAKGPGNPAAGSPAAESRDANGRRR